MKIVLFDVIGQKSGMDYYDTAFYSQLRSNGFDAEIHSNYSIGKGKPFITNIYEGNKVKKIFNLLKLLPVFIKDVCRNRKSAYVYMAFGEWVDMVLICLLLVFHPKPILDVHEFVSLDKEGNRKYTKVFEMLYKHIYALIYHSERSERYLDRISFGGKRLYVPHFKYEFPKSYNTLELNGSVINSISSHHINILFFGHMRKSKGINFVFDSIKKTEADVLKRLHFIFAGNDAHLIVKKRIGEIKELVSCSTILRFIEDEELNYLFDNTDIVLLPYEEVSQSGILEAAVYFRKKMILTDIPYFKSFSQQYPSFSYIVEKGNITALSTVYKEICYNGIKAYMQQDIEQFYETNSFKVFFQQLRHIL